MHTQINIQSDTIILNDFFLIIRELYVNVFEVELYR